MDLILFIVGTTILLVSGDLLVRAAIDISFKMKISPMIVGLTVIAFGTSAPELLVGIQATWNGYSGLALGNIIGSNIANVFLILGNQNSNIPRIIEIFAEAFSVEALPPSNEVYGRMVNITRQVQVCDFKRPKRNIPKLRHLFVGKRTIVAQRE